MKHLYIGSYERGSPSLISSIHLVGPPVDKTAFYFIICRMVNLGNESPVSSKQGIPIWMNKGSPRVGAEEREK